MAPQFGCVRRVMNRMTHDRLYRDADHMPHLTRGLDMTTNPLIPRSMSIVISMFAFFLIFATVGGMVELLSDGPEGQQAYALFAASASTVIYGLALSWIGTRLPARWWGEALLVGVIFLLIWLLMNAISGTLDGDAVVSGLLYTVISGLIGGLFFEVFSRTSK